MNINVCDCLKKMLASFIQGCPVSILLDKNITVCGSRIACAMESQLYPSTNISMVLLPKNICELLWYS